MTRKIVNSFYDFTLAIDQEVSQLLLNRCTDLTHQLAKIQWSLWKEYKRINGTSAGFHGISEYIVFAAVKKFVDLQNPGCHLETKLLSKDLFSLVWNKHNSSLEILRSARLKHLPTINVNRAPDIAIIKTGKNSTSIVAVIEIKNILDKAGTLSALQMLAQVSKELCWGALLENRNTLEQDFVSLSKEIKCNERCNFDKRLNQKLENSLRISRTAWCRG